MSGRRISGRACRAGRSWFSVLPVLFAGPPLSAGAGLFPRAPAPPRRTPRNNSVKSWRRLARALRARRYPRSAPRAVGGEGTSRSDPRLVGPRRCPQDLETRSNSSGIRDCDVHQPIRVLHRRRLHALRQHGCSDFHTVPEKYPHPGSSVRLNPNKVTRALPDDRTCDTLVPVGQHRGGRARYTSRVHEAVHSGSVQVEHAPITLAKSSRPAPIRARVSLGRRSSDSETQTNLGRTHGVRRAARTMLRTTSRRCGTFVYPGRSRSTKANSSNSATAEAWPQPEWRAVVPGAVGAQAQRRTSNGLARQVRQAGITTPPRTVDIRRAGAACSGTPRKPRRRKERRRSSHWLKPVPRVGALGETSGTRGVLRIARPTDRKIEKFANNVDARLPGNRRGGSNAEPALSAIVKPNERAGLSLFDYEPRLARRSALPVRAWPAPRVSRTTTRPLCRPLRTISCRTSPIGRCRMRISSAPVPMVDSRAGAGCRWFEAGLHVAPAATEGV